MLGISFFNKNVKKLVHQHSNVWTPPLTFEALWETLGMGKKPTQQPKIYSFPPSEKSSLIDLNISLLKVQFLTHQIAIFK